MKSPNKTEPIGLCIFCGVTAGELAAAGRKLTSEHVMPDGLGAVLEVDAATCPGCQNQLHPFEEYCLRDLFGPIRAYLKAYGPQSEVPETLPIRYTNEDGSTEPSRVRVESFPFFVGMPLLPPPGILAGRDPTCGVLVGECGANFWRVPDYDDRCARISANDPRHREVRTEVDIKVGPLCRFLAKVAHCLAWFGYAERVSAIETWLLPDLILGRVDARSAGPYFVGGAMYGEARIEDISLNTINPHFARLFEIRTEEAIYTMARIQFFAGQQMPVYEVVIARRGRRAR